MREIKLIDRSRIVSDWSCGRKRYWNYEYGGKGIVSSNTNLDLYMGVVIHDSLAGIAHQHDHNIPQGLVDIDLIADLARKQIFDTLTAQTSGEVSEIDFALEQSSLVEGMIRGFYRCVWPKLIEGMKIVNIESEMEYKIDDSITMMCKPDLILEDEEGEWHYVEYKSTSSKKDNWVNSWGTAVQLHSTIKAVEQTLGKAPTTVNVVGLYKGFESYGKQSSPFCYSYQRKGQPPFSKDEVQYEYKAGFKRYPVWELSGGVKKWVEEMPETVLVEQFPRVPPIFVNEDLVHDFFEQTKYREHEIKLAMDMIEVVEDKRTLMNASFPQNYGTCHAYYGRNCEFMRLCFGNGGDPLNEGFEFRVPHHEPEVKLWEEMNDQRNSSAEVG